MIKKILEKFIQKFSSKILLRNIVSRCFVLLLFFSFSSSCTDQGCIEADDFGEYQTQTLEVLANSTSLSCKYDSTLAGGLFDAGQGPGIKSCLTSGAVAVSDESGLIQRTTAGGCSGDQVSANGTAITPATKMDAPHTSLCINMCVNSCLGGSSGSSSPEPNWKATDSRNSSQNYGVQILPGSQIVVTATGQVTLSNSANYPTAYIPVDGLLDNGMHPNYKSSSWSNDFIFDVTKGQSFNSKFSGNWNRGTSTTYFNNNSATNNSTYIGGGVNKLGTNSGVNWNIPIYNGARTLAAYTIPHPAGYNFDSSQNDETLGTKGTPLLPNPTTWECYYTKTKNDYVIPSSLADPNSYPAPFLESDCHNKQNGYATLGYSSSVDNAVLGNSGFIIKSSDKSDGLGTYGGLIRWDKDGIINGNQPIFGSLVSKLLNVISTYEYGIPAGSTFDGNNIVPLSPGLDVTTLPTSGITITNTDTDPYMIYIRGSYSNDANHNSSSDPIYQNAAVTLQDSSGINVSTKTNLDTSINLQSYGHWGLTSPTNITIDPGQKIIIAPKVIAGSDLGTLSVAAKFHKFKDILIERSGFVRFTTLNAQSGSCTLNGRIINPKDSSANSRSNNDPDFYEYDDFLSGSSSKDPFNSLAVPTSSSSNYSWSNKVFVRKGQVIRLAPDSWNGTFTTESGLTRQCGIGMAMQITPRPALLCKGVAEEAISNTDSKCLPDIDLSTGGVIGCKAYSSACYDASNTSYYCPFSACQATISCDPGSDPDYKKTSCTSSSNTASNDCANAIASFSSSSQNTFKNTSCLNCSANMLSNAQNLPAKVTAKLDQCYDLENYTGRVNDIPTASGTVINSSDPIYSKGATKIKSFNGSYGNFENFSDSKATEATSPKNIIYQANSPMQFAQNSRLRFLFLTNNGDFRNLDSNYSSSPNTGASYPYSNLSGRGSSYSGQNGFKVSFDGTLQFSNGQWLEAKLCREDNSHSCRSLNISPDITAITAQPILAELNDATATNPNPTPKSEANYKFDDFGTLTRKTAPSISTDCNIANQAVDTQINSPFYCHSYLGSNGSIYLYDSKKSAPFSDSDYNELNKLRLTFKIKDPEVPNCVIPTSTTSSSDPVNGIIMTNPAYSSGASDAIPGQTCGYNELATLSMPSPIPQGATQCKKQFYCGSVYANNNGSYQVTVKVTNPPGSNISNIIGGVITPVVETMDGKRTIAADGTVTTTVGQSQRIYSLVVQDDRYQAILSMCMVMMLTFYGVTYLMGITDLSSSDLLNRAIKISIIYFFASPSGWYWFNMFAVKWFKDGTDYLAFMMASSFDDSPALAKALSLNDYYDKSVLFSSVDKVFGMFFSQAVQKKISALLFASIFGFVYLWIIYLSFMCYIYAVGYSILYYLTAQIFISILFTLGPIFFIFTLFNQTKEMFDSWLKQLIGFSLQQILLLTTLAFFNMMMYEVLKMSLGYRICWDEVWSINIITRVSLLSFWTIASLPPRLNTQSEVGDIGHPEGIPSLFSILFIWVIASLMQEFVTFMTNLGATLGGSMKASALGSGVAAAIGQAQKYSSQKFDDLKKATIDEPMKRLDAALFDSGEHAEKARKAREEKNRTDQLSKDSLTAAGSAAMSTFRINNPEMFCDLEKDPAKAAVAVKALDAAKEAGIKKEAKKLGISDDDLKRLKSDKGLKYEGSNLGAAAMQAVRQKLGYGGGTLDKSIDDQKVKLSLTHDEMTSAMKNAKTSEERDSLSKAVKSGSLLVDKTHSERAVNAATGAAKVVATPVSGIVAGTAGATLGGAVDLMSGGKTNFAGSALKFAGDRAKGSYSGIGSTKDSLVNAAGKISGKVRSEVGYGDYNKAQEELIASGDIKKMAFGTSFARPQEEKDKITARAKENKAAKAASMPKTNSAVSIAKLESLNKGLTKDEANPGLATSISSAVFGAGGLSRMVAAQGEKFSAATSSASAANQTAQISAKFGAELSATKDRKTSLEETAAVAATAANSIKTNGAAFQETQSKIAALSKAPKSDENDKAMKEAQEKMEGIKKDDTSGYFANADQMNSLREQQKTATTPEEQASIAKKMSNITKDPNYIESQGNGLNNANATYQRATQDAATLGIKIDKMQTFSDAIHGSAEKDQLGSKTIYDKVMDSAGAQAALKAKEDYDKLGTLTKMTNGGLFSSDPEAKKTIATFKQLEPEYKKIEQMQKDYGKLSSLQDRDLTVNKDGVASLGSTTGGNRKFVGLSKAAAKHDDFAEKYKDTKID